MLPTSPPGRRLAAEALAFFLLAYASFLYEVPYGPPGSPAYPGYEAKNRLTGGLLVILTVTLVMTTRQAARSGATRGLVAASLGAAVGAGLAALGSIAEFWVFTGQAYSGPASGLRGAAWAAFVVGSLILVGSGALAALWPRPRAA